MRQYGPNWGGAPTNTGSNFNPPNQVQIFLNEGNNNFLARTMLFEIATIQVSFLTTLNTNSYSINPIPANGTTINPAALRIYEMTYTPLNSNQRRIDFFDTKKFRAATGQYMNRLGAYSSWPQFATQLWGKRTIDIWPGTATAGDTISLTICPDPSSSPITCPASNGGLLVNGTDQLLYPPQFHLAPVHYAVAQLASMGDKPELAEMALKQYEQLVVEAMTFGASVNEGDPSQYMIDPWSSGGIW